MAEASERLTHPILGTLGWLPDYSHWFVQLPKATGGRLDVIIDPGGGDRHAFLDQAAYLFSWAMDNERRILADAVLAELLDLFNHTWRQSDEPVVSAGELTDRLTWQLLVVGASEFVPVEFGYDAGDLFGGHGVNVEVDGKLQFRDIDLQG